MLTLSINSIQPLHDEPNYSQRESSKTGVREKLTNDRELTILADENFGFVFHTLLWSVPTSVLDSNH